jgi:hypothetical protein
MKLGPPTAGRTLREMRRDTWIYAAASLAIAAASVVAIAQQAL